MRTFRIPKIYFMMRPSFHVVDVRGMRILMFAYVSFLKMGVLTKYHI